MTMSKTETSIIVVNYNGLRYTEACLDSIYNSNTENFEVIVVDNGSVDDSVTKLKAKFSSHLNFRLVELDKNYGPAKARNEGVKLALGNYLAFLDNDTLVKSDWATTAITFFSAHPEVGVLQCKLLLANGKNEIDYVGEYLGQNGFLVQRGVTGSIDTGQYDSYAPILAAKSAGMFISKNAFNNAGGFDDDYFIYVEETDLGWRAWLAGYKVLFFPESVVFHEFGTSSVILSSSQNNYNTKFHGCKNYIMTLTKNLGFTKLVQILPLHVLMWVGLAWFSLLSGQRASFINIHKAFFWHLQNIGKTLQKRQRIQSMRKIADKELFADLMIKQPFSYFLDKAVTHRKVGNAEGFIKKN